MLRLRCYSAAWHVESAGKCQTSLVWMAAVLAVMTRPPSGCAGPRPFSAFLRGQTAVAETPDWRCASPCQAGPSWDWLVAPPPGTASPLLHLPSCAHPLRPCFLRAQPTGAPSCQPSAPYGKIPFPFVQLRLSWNFPVGTFPQKLREPKMHTGLRKKAAFHESVGFPCGRSSDRSWRESWCDPLSCPRSEPYSQRPSFQASASFPSPLRPPCLVCVGRGSSPGYLPWRERKGAGAGSFPVLPR